MKNSRELMCTSFEQKRQNVNYEGGRHPSCFFLLKLLKTASIAYIFRCLGKTFKGKESVTKNKALKSTHWCCKNAFKSGLESINQARVMCSEANPLLIRY